MFRNTFPPVIFFGVGLMLFPIIVASIFLNKGFEGGYYFGNISISENFTIFLVGLGSLTFILGLSIIMFEYLRGTLRSKQQFEFKKYDPNLYNSSLENDLILILNKIDSLDNRVENLKSSEIPLDKDAKNQIYLLLKEQIEKNLSNNFLHSIEEKYAEKFEINYLLQDMEKQCARTEKRLLAEIGALSRRGNLNLIIGVITTFIAVGILASSIVYNILPNEPEELIVFLVPRITLSLFIEVFSFFFLRLYSASLRDIKYFQNELTNIESKFIALRRASQLVDQKAFLDILIELSGTERNFILKKGESTVSLEKSKFPYQETKDILNQLIKLTKEKSA